AGESLLDRRVIFLILLKRTNTSKQFNAFIIYSILNVYDVQLCGPVLTDPSNSHQVKLTAAAFLFQALSFQLHFSAPASALQQIPFNYTFVKSSHPAQGMYL
ncbi:hypothetical protein GOODEAATRI_031167, partial [Goodea atripinnis]